MGDVLDLQTKERTLQGEVRCLHCKHTWQCVTPAGTFIELECPSCGLNKGVLSNLCNPVDDQDLWHCNCGCDVFMVLRSEFMCLQCGTPQRFGDLNTG